MKKIIVVAAGTGGHIYPAIAVAEKLQENISKEAIIFVCSKKEIDRSIVNKHPFPVVALETGNGNKMLLLLFLFINGLRMLDLYFREKPGVIFSTGGMASFPAVLAGWFMRIPVILHEQNVLPGKSNRLLSWFASKVILSFEESKKHFSANKTLVMGNPVREKIKHPDNAWTRQKLPFVWGKRMVLVVGGSQGSRAINDVIIGLYEKKLVSDESFTLFHITGNLDFSRICARAEAVKLSTINGQDVYQSRRFKGYYLAQFIEEMDALYAAAELVVSRGGATALSEICARGLPAIIIPYPHAAENHQQINAEYYEKKGAGIMVLDKDLSPGLIADKMMRILTDNQLQHNMAEAALKESRPNAAGLIAEEIISRLENNRVG